jgi:hypothetical protein
MLKEWAAKVNVQWKSRCETLPSLLDLKFLAEELGLSYSPVDDPPTGEADNSSSSAKNLRSSKDGSIFTATLPLHIDFGSTLRQHINWRVFIGHLR